MRHSICFVWKRQKKKCITVLINNPDLLPYVKLFLTPNADPQAIANAGNQFLLRLYDCSAANSTLNALRHKTFIRTAYNSTHNIANLPPTEAAAEQHSYRTYHQVQLWQGNELKPEKWGWKRTHEGLSPVTTSMPPLPPQLLKLISCKCKKGCRGACSCRKSGLRCSVMCLQCNNTCENAPDEDIGDLENDEDDPQEVNLELLDEEMDREEDSLEQPDDDHPGERSDTENSENLIGEFFILLPFSLHASHSISVLLPLSLSVHLSLSLPILNVKMC